MSKQEYYECNLCFKKIINHEKFWGININCYREISLCYYSDANIHICGTCAYQLKQEFAKINFDFIEKQK